MSGPAAQETRNCRSAGSQRAANRDWGQASDEPLTGTVIPRPGVSTVGMLYTPRSANGCSQPYTAISQAPSDRQRRAGTGNPAEAGLIWLLTRKKGSELLPIPTVTGRPLRLQMGLGSRLQSPSDISNGHPGKTGLSPAASTTYMWRQAAERL